MNIPAEVAILTNEKRTAIGVSVNGSIVSYRPIDVLPIAAHILDHAARDGEFTTIHMPDHPELTVKRPDAIAFARELSAAADQLLTEADFKF